MPKTAKKTAKKATAAKTADKPKPLTKNQLVANIAEKTGFAKKDVVVLFDALTEEINDSFGKKGAKVFVLPGLIKIDLKNVKAQPAKKNVTNPLTGELYDKPAKKACQKIRVRALKSLKDLV